MSFKRVPASRPCQNGANGEIRPAIMPRKQLHLQDEHRDTKFNICHQHCLSLRYIWTAVMPHSVTSFFGFFSATYFSRSARLDIAKCDISRKVCRRHFWYALNLGILYAYFGGAKGILFTYWTKLNIFLFTQINKTKKKMADASAKQKRIGCKQRHERRRARASFTSGQNGKAC